MEGIGKEMFEEWMKRLMERIDRLDSIISVQRFRSEYGLRYQKISRKTYYKESDVLEFISRNMEEVTLDGKKLLKVKEGTGKKAPGKTAKGKKGGKRNTGTDKHT